MSANPFAHVEPYQVWENAFTPAELDAVEAYGDRLALGRGTVLSDGPEITYDALRIVQTAPMTLAPEITWLYERIERVLRVFNQQTYHFDLMGFSEPFQYMVYHGNEGGHFGWHIDQVRGANHRKLSFSLQLSGPEDYDGGELVIHGGGQPATAPKTRGALVAFPSYALHRVAPVTAGTRKALVFWAAGPPFR